MGQIYCIQNVLLTRNDSHESHYPADRLARYVNIHICSPKRTYIWRSSSNFSTIHFSVNPRVSTRGAYVKLIPFSSPEARALDFFRRPERSWALGTRMFKFKRKREGPIQGGGGGRGLNRGEGEREGEALFSQIIFPKTTT